MNTLIVVLSKKLQGRYRIIHPIRYCFFDSYIYLYAEKLVATMNYLLCDSTFMLELKKELNDNYARGYYTLHYIILRIYERLRWLLGYYYRHSYVRGFLNRVTNHMKQILLIDFKDNAFRVFDRAEEKLHDPKDYSPTNIRQKT